MGTPPVMHCKSNWQEIDETVLRWPLKCHRYTECTLSDHFSMYTHKSICGTIEMPSSNKINNGLGGWRQKTYCTVRSVSTVSSSFHFLLSLPTLFFFLTLFCFLIIFFCLLALWYIGLYSTVPPPPHLFVCPKFLVTGKLWCCVGVHGLRQLQLSFILMALLLSSLSSVFVAAYHIISH